MKLSLRTWLILVTLCCCLLASCEFGYRPSYYEARFFVWVRCGPFCVRYSQPSPQFSQRYRPQLTLRCKQHAIRIPESYDRYYP